MRGRRIDELVPPARDARLAAGLAAVVLLVDLLERVAAGAALHGVVDRVAAVAVLAPLAWRRRAPLVVPAAVLVLAFGVPWPESAEGEFSSAYVAAVVALAVASGTAAALRGWPGALLAVAADLAVMGFRAILARSPAPLLEGSWATLRVIVPAVLVGLVLHERERRARERALRREQGAWEHERRAAEEERRRIARELHDVVAHHVSGMVVSAAAARELLPREREPGRRALATVAETAVATQEAMGRLVEVLGQPGEPAPAGTEPTLRELEALVASFHRLGSPVRVRARGDLGALPPDLDRCAYRIVKEALTNVLKHARGAPARVDVQADGTAVVLDVENLPPPSGARTVAVPGDGHGVVGMRERVALFGGELHAGPTAAGGWRVSATLPRERDAA